ncbi:PAS domain S-box-containing protein/diguanylate cyclase (GGDEF)-like protein [Anoxybacillus vitaminiphilus]|uniref:PAS domain S-box-containing protein/diguanylate cyclase (GGDEF)-like protein n=1 Tax=Paranoxybacillus vitaminiphilus TaxID=581036 RepID=A0A327YCY4_9BACL|nr:EAL domain-containing protein [Anoxybacillus vitaminiphilus]RAK18948.1 PAS domain S-box-containing protein/diguanylate cyclase (GGDEF)-like protein [Anoxybacillus vitaminiphilus]
MHSDNAKELVQTTFAEIAKKVIEYTSEGIIVTDSKGNILLANPAFEVATGYSVDEVVGKNPRILQSGLHDKKFYEKMWEEIEKNGFWKGEIWNKRKDGELFVEWLTISSIKDKEGNVVNYVAIFSDITEHKRNVEQLKRLAHYDILTGVPNRYLFTKRLESLIQTSRKYDQQFALLFLDLDRFKNINDTLGHHMGDLLLQKTAQRLKGILRKQDTIARIGGDEFVIILPNLKHIREAVHIAERIIESLKASFWLNGQEVYISTSIGISFYPYDGEDIETLVRKADRAMYQAKKSGRNQFELYHNELHINDKQTLLLENALRKAIDCNELQLHYQPQMNTQTKQICGVEALIRWKHPEMGYVSPGKFIPIAEESGLIIPISDWVLRQACEDLKKLHLDYPHLKMSVNISSIYFQQADFMKRLQSTIEAANIHPRLFELELTESTIMPNAEQSIARLVKLKKFGLKIAIDDFGTGFSSLSYLHRFPIDILKIDQSFIKHLSSYEDDASIVTAIIKMAHNLRLQVIAEGVETEKQCKFLQKQGCDYVQGYYVSKPLPLAELYEFLETWNQC